MENRRPVWEEIREALKLLAEHQWDIGEVYECILKCFLYVTKEEINAIKNMIGMRILPGM